MFYSHSQQQMGEHAADTAEPADSTFEKEVAVRVMARFRVRVNVRVRVGVRVM